MIEVYLKKAVPCKYAWRYSVKDFPLKLLNKILEKILRKSLFLVTLHVSKRTYSHLFLKVFVKSLSNFIYDFWEDSFHKTKLLLAANRLIFLNMSLGISKVHVPYPPRTP